MTLSWASVAPYAVAYVVTAAVMLAVDLVWLGVIAKLLYAQAIGHLMSDKPYLPAALLFYAIFPWG